jgi:hypothetical protein
VELTTVPARARNGALHGSGDERLAALRAAIAADMRLATRTKAVREELGQTDRYTDRRGVSVPVWSLTGEEAQAALQRLSRHATRLHRAALAAYLTRRYPRPDQAEVDRELAALSTTTATDWLRSQPLYRALEQRAGI